MEILKKCLKRLYFPFWSTSSIIFLILGFNALHRTGLSESVSPAIMFLFKHAFAISVFHSSDYRVITCKDADFKERHPVVLVLVLMFPILYVIFTDLIPSDTPFTLRKLLLSGFLVYSFYGMCYAIGKGSTLPDLIDHVVHSNTKLILLVYGHSRKFIPVLVLLMSCLTSFFWAAVSEEKVDSGDVEMLPTSLNSSTSTTTITTTPPLQIKDRTFKLIEFAIGVLGGALFQYFFQLKSFDHVLTFLYFSAAWLGNLALVGPSTDLGIFNFLLGNVMVGSTMSRFGLGGKTWIAYAAAVFLYLVRLLLK